MQQLLQSHDVSIIASKRVIAETMSSQYSLPFDGSDIHIAIYVALYHYWELKKKRISRTLQSIRQHGIVEAVDKLVSRDYDSYGFTTLHNNDMIDRTFEHVVICYPTWFSDKAKLMAIRRFI